jgi:hypothetical protein
MKKYDQKNLVKIDKIIEENNNYQIKSLINTRKGNYLLLS